jgi:MSHA pilin protein MshA
LEVEVLGHYKIFGNNKKGFTPIELIIVIVVLSILSVTVALRFIDISADTRTAILTLTKAQLGNTLRLALANF